MSSAEHMPPVWGWALQMLVPIDVPRLRRYSLPE